MVSPGLYVVDTGYVGPEIAAAHLLVSGGRAAFVDVGASSSAPRLLAALDNLGIERAAVQWVVVSHVHLDHAGGTGALVWELPNARVLVHPRGARHLVDPSRLIAGSRVVYGDTLFDQLYGTVEPVSSERIVISEDEGEVPFGNTRLRLLHTRGHANHHHCVLEPELGALFTGDTFGLAYPRLRFGGLPFVVATTTPVDFDPQALRASVLRLLGLDPAMVCLTHFGPVREVGFAAEQVLEEVDRMVALVAAHPDDLPGAILAHWTDRLGHFGHPEAGSLAAEVLLGDANLNALGLLHWAQHKAGG